MGMDGRTDGWTNMTMLTGAFRDYDNTPKNDNCTYDTWPFLVCFAVVQHYLLIYVFANVIILCLS